MLTSFLLLITAVLNFGLAVHNHSYLSGVAAVLYLLAAISAYT